MFPFPVLAWLGTVLLVPLVIVPNGDDHLLAYRWLAWAGLTLGLFVSPPAAPMRCWGCWGCSTNKGSWKRPGSCIAGPTRASRSSEKVYRSWKSFGRAARPVR
jgi:hypothetical protein